MTQTPVQPEPQQAHSHPLYRIASQALGALRWTVLPPQCMGCGRSFNPGAHIVRPADERKLQESLCVFCHQALLKRKRVACLRCGLGLGPRLQAFGWTHCRHCRTLDPAPGRNTWVCADYEAPFDLWIRQLKYHGAFEVAPFLAAWMSLRLRHPENQGRRLPDVWMPIPAHPDKLRQRGYNQAALIAKALARYTGRPCVSHILIKTAHTTAQAALTREERLHNLASAFLCVKPVRQDWCIGLVDDVMTTGSTFDLCSDALLKAGAKEVLRYAVCRTPE